MEMLGAVVELCSWNCDQMPGIAAGGYWLCRIDKSCLFVGERFHEFVRIPLSPIVQNNPGRHDDTATGGFLGVWDIGQTGDTNALRHHA